MLYFVYPETVKHDEIEEWANTNIGIRDSSFHSWNWVGLPSRACIGLRLPTSETIVAFKLRFPYPMFGEFEVTEETTYAEMVGYRKHLGI